MDIYFAIHTRFGFEIPQDYRRFWEAGLLSNEGFKGLRVSRHFWMSPSDIFECEWPRYKLPALVPCARTPGRDHYCWYNDPSRPAWIADCPRDSSIASAVAANFEAFVFKTLLEEASDTWLFTVENVGEVFGQYVKNIGSSMRPDWIQILAAIAGRAAAINAWDRPQLISEEEAAEIVANELKFELDGREFGQDTV